MPQEPAAQKLDTTPSANATILAIDYGRARLGLAITDTEAELPKPLETLERVNRNEDMRRLRELARDHHVKQIVVGLPLRLDGTRGDMAEEAARFAARVRKQLGIPVDMVDERLTSWEAERILEEQSGRVLRHRGAQGKRRQSGTASVDSMAAAVILREYLAQGRATKHPPENI